MWRLIMSRGWRQNGEFWPIMAAFYHSASFHFYISTTVAKIYKYTSTFDSDSFFCVNILPSPTSQTHKLFFLSFCVSTGRCHPSWPSPPSHCHRLTNTHTPSETHTHTQWKKNHLLVMRHFTQLTPSFSLRWRAAHFRRPCTRAGQTCLPTERLRR